MIRRSLADPVGHGLAYLLFHPPRRRHHRTPSDVGLTAVEQAVRTGDGLPLHLWLIPGDGAGTAIVGHGIGLTKSASLRQVALLHELGYHVVAFDHRNHGLSGTDRSRHGLAERYSNDITTAIEAAHRAWPPIRHPLVVWGFSFSTFPTLHNLRHPTTPISAIICDSGPGLELDTMLRGFLTGGHLPLPALVRRVVQRRSVVEAFTSAAVTMLGTAWPPDPGSTAAGTTPMLFLTGATDEIVDPAQVQALASRYPHHQLVPLPAGHLDGIKQAPQEYAEAVTSFLGTSLTPYRRP